MNRDEKLSDLRSPIPILIEDSAVSEAERFQNQTLRPILKYQNELLLIVYQNYLELRKGQFFGLSKEKRLLYIENSVRKDLKLKHLLLGIVVGLFTSEEWKIYKNHERELRKRITSLLIQRVQDQMEKFESP